MDCPVCKARNVESAQCRRCRVDLSLLVALEAERGRLLSLARRAAANRDWANAARLAATCSRLRAGEDAERLEAVGLLMRHDFAGALRAYFASISSKAGGRG